MAGKLQDVATIEEFRRLYYPDATPTLEYFDGIAPGVQRDDDDKSDGAVVDPIDRVARNLAIGE